MKTRQNSIPISEARQGLPSLIDKVMHFHNRYFITKRGKIEAVIISADEFESWVETLDILSSKSEMRTLKAALSNIRKGKAKSFKDIFEEDL